MIKKIYGVDPTKKVKPKMVRNAIIKCFFEAHKEVLDDVSKIQNIDERELKEIKKLNVEALIRKFFKEIQADFDEPTKEDLIKICDKLADYASNFRKPQIITKHYKEIMTLINKL